MEGCAREISRFRPAVQTLLNGGHFAWWFLLVFEEFDQINPETDSKNIAVALDRVGDENLRVGNQHGRRCGIKDERRADRFGSARFEFGGAKEIEEFSLAFFNWQRIEAIDTKNKLMQAASGNGFALTECDVKHGREIFFWNTAVVSIGFESNAPKVLAQKAVAIRRNKADILLTFSAWVFRKECVSLRTCGSGNLEDLCRLLW